MKHPLLDSSKKIIVWGLAWLVLAACQSLLIYFVYGSKLGFAILDGATTMILFGLLGLAVWFPVRFILRGENQAYQAVFNVVLTGSVTIVAWLYITRFLVRAMVTEKMDYVIFWHSSLVFRITAGILIYFVILLVYYMFLSASQLAEKAARQAQLETQVRNGELMMLRSQINPHFLFNSLNSISSLTVTDPLRAREMIVKLSDFMRYSLSSRNDQPVSLRNELQSLRLYLQIEKIRFGDRLSIEEDITPEAYDALMPGMLLQPLYENAIKHGVYESTGEVVIRTTAKVEDGKMKISITNNVDTEAVVTRKGAGIGLKNVSSRLELLFGKKANVTINRTDDSFCVLLEFPYQTN